MRGQAGRWAISLLGPSPVLARLSASFSAMLDLLRETRTWFCVPSSPHKHTPFSSEDTLGDTGSPLEMSGYPTSQGELWAAPSVALFEPCGNARNTLGKRKQNPHQMLFKIFF